VRLGKWICRKCGGSFGLGTGSGRAIPLVRLIHPIFDIVSAAVEWTCYGLGLRRTLESALGKKRNSEDRDQFPKKENHHWRLCGIIKVMQSIVVNFIKFHKLGQTMK
jgi:hypothetical protein